MDGADLPDGIEYVMWLVPEAAAAALRQFKPPTPDQYGSQI
jgi:hypothetical protein